jgi:hypothetical protein
MTFALVNVTIERAFGDGDGDGNGDGDDGDGDGDDGDGDDGDGDGDDGDGDDGDGDDGDGDGGDGDGNGNGHDVSAVADRYSVGTIVRVRRVPRCVRSRPTCTSTARSCR